MADLNSKVESSAFGRFWRSFNDLLTTTKVGGVAVNAFGELIRQPVFLLLFTLGPIFCVFLSLPSYFGFGGTSSGPVNFDIEMVKDGALTVAFLVGLGAAVLFAATSISREIESGTALAVLSKPVGRIHFLVGKYLGIIGALTLGTYLNFLGVLLASRAAHDAYADYDIVGTITLLLVIGLAYLAGGLVNFFLNKPFVPNTVMFLTVTLTIGFFVICHQDKTTAYYWYETLEGGVSQAGIEASFWEIWTWSDTGGIYPGATERLPKLAKDMDPWFYVDWGLVQLVVLILFSLWVLAALAVACSTRLSWMPTMMICVGVFLGGMMSDYFLGEAAEGGDMLGPGEYVEYSPPGKQFGLHEAFVMEPRGIRRLRGLQYRVRVYFEDTKYGGPLLDGDVITVDAGRTPVKRVDYDYIREKLNDEFKRHWNRPLYQVMISTGRELMAGGFPTEPWESAAYFQSEDFRQRKEAKRTLWEARAKQEGRAVAEIEAEMTQSLIFDVQFEKEQELVTRMMQAVDQHIAALRLGEHLLAEYTQSQSLNTDEKLKAHKEAQIDRYRHFQYLRKQSQLETLPGNLSFWIYPVTGELAKWDNQKGRLASVSSASSMAKILYVLVPNWQLFWLSDAVPPEENELKQFRHDMRYTKGKVPWKYVFTSLGYVVLYVCLLLSVALMLFENRELS